MDFFDQDPSEYEYGDGDGAGAGKISEAEVNALEKLFISKLTEKYRLIDRDLKKGVYVCMYVCMNECMNECMYV